MSSYIFTDNPDYFSSANFGWQDAGTALWGIKASYKNAADELVGIALKEGEKQNISVLDTYIFPIMYLYRQSLEVSLKFIYHRCYGKIPKGNHNLEKLWDTVHREVVIKFIENEDFITKIKQYKKNLIQWSTYDINFSKTSQILNELQKFDKESDVWRYLVDKKGNLYITKSTYIDYHKLKASMDELYSIFDFLYGVIDEYLSS